MKKKKNDLSFNLLNQRNLKYKYPNKETLKFNELYHEDAMLYSVKFHREGVFCLNQIII